MCKCKKLKGYFTLEAVYIVPIVLLLYVLILLSGFYLYDRCVMSQDSYLLAFRASRFTNIGENYGEIIYADMSEGNFEEGYIRDRLTYKIRFYPYLGEGKLKVYIQDEAITVALSGFDGLLNVSKSVKRENPLEIIQNVRRRQNGN